MINLLQIRNFAIIESLDLELGAGFTAITGETGAGKSILVDALGLLLGGRADTGTIRSGCDKAELTAEFEIDNNSAALEWLKQTELDDDQGCLLRRLIHRNGRSRAWINGTAVTLSQLQELGQSLVEIHGQNEHIRLVTTAEQFKLLDADERCASMLQQLLHVWSDWHEIELELIQLDAESPLAAGELDLLNYQIDELEGVALSAEALHKLEAEHKLLSHGKDVIVAMEAAMDRLQEDELGVDSQLQQIIGQLSAHTGLDSDIDNAVNALNEAAINCQEARSSLQAAQSRISLNPQRLAELDHSIGRLFDLARKHRVEPSLLPGVLVSLRDRCELAATRHERRQELVDKQPQRLRKYRQAADKLHKAREKHASTLSHAVSDLMQVLGMEGGSFVIKVQQDNDAVPSQRGDDLIELLVSANPGVVPGPLRKVASGGELSRISLAVKVASAGGNFAPTQVFDEVDAGIGGETANSVGRLLQSVSSNGQALCVTHLAQVAVCADRQFRVLKSAEDQLTRVETSLLAENERVDEIARMLGGRLSDQSRAHARELLAGALTQH